MRIVLFGTTDLPHPEERAERAYRRTQDRRAMRVGLRLHNRDRENNIMKRLLLSAVAAMALITAVPALADAPKQGGAAVVTFNNDLTTLDPAIGYDWQNWSVIKSIFDGLMDYEPGSTKLVPDLAESYRSEEHTSELQSHSDLVCRLLLE